MTKQTHHSPPSFGCTISNNNRLHNKLSQEDQYCKYLKRIDNIVDRKLQVDNSSTFYMTFLSRCKNKANMHKKQERDVQLAIENRFLLSKITNPNITNSVDVLQPQNHRQLPLHEKRQREQDKINQQNFQLAKRLTSNYKISIHKTRTNQFFDNAQKSTSKKSYHAGWNYSPIKQRKLPKLVYSPQKYNERQNQNPLDYKQKSSQISKHSHSNHHTKTNTTHRGQSSQN